MDKDQFAGLIQSQFTMYEGTVNGIYWQAIRDNKSGWLGLTKTNYSALLSRASNTFLRSVENLADLHVQTLKGEARENAMLFKGGFIQTIMNTVEHSNRQVLDEIRASSLKVSTNTIESNPVFAQLNLKRMDSIGRSRSASKSIYLTSRHFALLVALQSDYVRYKNENIERVDILKDAQVLTTVLVDELMQEDVLKLFHPNSNLRTRAHVTQTQLNG
jgi:hypothetical protein